MVAYPPTNTVILTDAASNIRRILSIVALDRRRDLQGGARGPQDASTPTPRRSPSSSPRSSAPRWPTPARRRGRRRTRGAAARGAARRAARQTPRSRPRARSASSPTSARTRCIVLAVARAPRGDPPTSSRSLDVAVSGGGRIHVYYLKHADAEELAQTLNALISGPARPASSGGGPPPAAAAARAPRSPAAPRAAAAGAARSRHRAGRRRHASPPIRRPTRS